jgi:enoyl-CoA hydratase
VNTSDGAGGVTILTIDRPERLNAVDLETITALADRMDEAIAAGARVVVLTGEDRNFCAGADLGGVDDDAFATALGRALDALRHPEVVTIAAVDGVALGAGMQLAVACDVRVATLTARFGIPAARLGLAVDHETIRRLVAFAGEGTARAMLLAAEEITGDTARRIGLVQRIGVLKDALGWAADIAALAPLTIAAHKLGLERLAERADDAEVAAARRDAWTSDDLREGLAAFRERRPPVFRGR